MSMPNLAPGEKLSSRDKEALAKDNARESQNAMQMAANQRNIDIQTGRMKPIDQQIAEGIKGKLEREEFNQR